MYKPLDWLFHYSSVLSLSQDHQQLPYNDPLLLQNPCGIESEDKEQVNYLIM